MLLLQEALHFIHESFMWRADINLMGGIWIKQLSWLGVVTKYRLFFLEPSDSFIVVLCYWGTVVMHNWIMQVIQATAVYMLSA